MSDNNSENSLVKSLLSRKFDNLFDDIDACSIPIQYIGIIRIYIDGNEHVDVHRDKFKSTVEETVRSVLTDRNKIDDIRVIIDIDALADFVDQRTSRFYSRVGL
jgi:hypothetical protein